MNRIEKHNILNLYHEVKKKGTFDYLRSLEDFKKGEYYEFYRFLKANRQAISILSYNYSQLLNLVNYHNSPENQSKVWNETNPKYRWRQQRMIISLLFNYLASVFATVDYSRSKLEKYISKNSEIADNFKIGKEKYFIKNPQHRFIQDLRNYTSHNSYLNITTEFKANDQSKNVKRDIYMWKEDLLNFSKWSSFSKEFLSSQDIKVYIIDIIKSHYPLFTEFQNWTYLALLQVNPKFTLEFKDKLQTILKLAEEVNLAQTTLPFNHAYIRYLEQIIKESTYRCGSEFKYNTPNPQV